MLTVNYKFEVDNSNFEYSYGLHLKFEGLAKKIITLYLPNVKHKENKNTLIPTYIVYHTLRVMKNENSLQCSEK